MASVEFSQSVLKSKFRGCMVGVLAGDCVGNQVFFHRSKSLTEFMTNLLSEENGKLLPHTDDTRMTMSVASSLVEKGETNAKDIAVKFVKDFYKEPNRQYGLHVRQVFFDLHDSDYKDVFLPGKLQFDGTGSWGNGAAMRIAPVALFGSCKSEKYIMRAAKKCSLITHAHPNGYNGAILQCLAVSIALGLDPSQELDPVWFINCLLEKMEEIETMEIKPYCESLKTMKEYFLKNWEDISPTEIAETLGNGSDISAIKSVPPAIYSFLRGMKPFKDYFQNSNPFLRTLFFAIALGGDTDTIGAMAGGIAGAYYGEDMIPKVLQKRCEMNDEIIALADKLFDTRGGKIPKFWRVCTSTFSKRQTTD